MDATSAYQWRLYFGPKFKSKNKLHCIQNTNLHLKLDTTVVFEFPKMLE